MALIPDKNGRSHLEATSFTYSPPPYPMLWDYRPSAWPKCTTTGRESLTHPAHAFPPRRVLAHSALSPSAWPDRTTTSHYFRLEMRRTLSNYFANVIWSWSERDLKVIWKSGGRKTVVVHFSHVKKFVVGGTVISDDEHDNIPYGARRDRPAGIKKWRHYRQ